MTKNAVIIAVGMLLSMSLAGAAFAQSGHMMDTRGMRYGDRWSNYNASPEQVKAYQMITEKYQPRFLELADQMWAKSAQLNGAIAQDKIDKALVKKLAKETGAIMAQTYELRVEMLVDMREQGLSYYGMGMMHGGMMGGGMMGGGMMGGGMMGYGPYGGGWSGMMHGWGSQQ